MVQELHEGFATPEEEVRELERRLEEKKRLLGEAGREVPHEKEVLREVLREHITEARGEGVGEEGVRLPSSHRHLITDTDTNDPAALQKEKERETEIRALVEEALTRGILPAVKDAASRSPYLLDELHDHLVDDFYQKLIVLRKIKEL